ncbi:MAG: PaaI family thioesterase [Proteobacteria bacterium]|nr:PaaI family thioesterase [Pseudomonadota bacterium]
MSHTEPLPQSWIEQLRALAPAMMAASPYARALGAELGEVERGVALLRLPYQEAFIGDPSTGVIAGGVVTALLDQTCGYAVWSALDQFAPIATLDLRIDYMRPARPREPLQARAECYKLGRAIAFVRGLAFETDPGDPVAAAQGVFVLRGKKAGAELRGRTSPPAKTTVKADGELEGAATNSSLPEDPQ